MTICELVRDNLEAAVAGLLDGELSRHLEECADCRDTVRRAGQSGRGGAMLRTVRAPVELKEKLKTMARLDQECERAVELFSSALDGEIDASRQGELLSHLRGCRACLATWEAMATLREVGSLTTAPTHTRAALAVHPENRIAVRRRRQPFNLRLATAAAYFLAALTVFLIGNPAHIARASNVPLERAAIYTRAAVENRFDSITRRVRKGVTATQSKANEMWSSLRGLLKRAPENSKPSGSVVPDGNGGRS
ncbi:MAG: zf-HC2 domain-containing protein [Thermoanaerobaculaceae bacterium]|nr:zf-HC2 domain-containing protein [Thermoanaerobaculaceae bacterium]MDI9623037.1 zf-HC2 domain-containing protein [Acidobacteriota bacterium]NLH10462.1 zf-HC2 domain-containing protein [Holophagae bacterium]HPW56792.1 zf-HC2 domain-containing protein [Thermoanaerobaculaceae bacterium]